MPDWPQAALVTKNIQNTYFNNMAIHNHVPSTQFPFVMEEDFQSSQPLPIKQLSAPTSSALKTPNSHTPTHQNSRSFFILPLELRAKIYRHILISRLDCGSHPRLWRPVGVDGGILRIGYFERDTVIPLLLVCRQMFVIRVPVSFY